MGRFGRTNNPDCTIVFIIRQMLTLEKRFPSVRTIGEVFKGALEEACILTMGKDTGYHL